MFAFPEKPKPRRIASHTFVAVGAAEICEKCGKRLPDCLSGEGVTCYGYLIETEKAEVRAEKKRYWDAVLEACKV